MDTLKYIQQHQWHVFGQWKEPTALEYTVALNMIQPIEETVFSFRPSVYVIARHRQFARKDEFEQHVSAALVELEHDPRGVTKRMQKQIYRSVAFLNSLSFDDFTPERVKTFLLRSGLHGRQWYEIMVLDSALQQLLPRYLPDHVTLDGKTFPRAQLFAKTALPKHRFPIMEERNDLLRLAIKKQQGKDITDDLQKHAKTYGWMNALCWYAEPFTPEHYARQIGALTAQDPEKELHHLQAEREKQHHTGNALLDALKIHHPEAAVLIDVIRDLADLKEENWDAVSLVGYRMHKALKKLAQKHHLSYNQLICMTPNEMMEAARGHLTVDIEELNRRHRGAVLLISLEKQEVSTGPIVEKMANILESETTIASALSGMVIWEGSVTGVARVLRSVDEIDTMQEGEILVCPMTDPDYMPAIYKAKAVVTDQGGLLCHAAIVARELRKPCLVGTEHATKWIKTGEKIALDTKKGIVKKIKP